MGLSSEDQIEAGSAKQGESQLAEAQRIRQQAVRMVERMMRDVMGSSGDTIGGLEIWQDAVMLRALAEEEMEYAREEARRLPAEAAAERDELRARHAAERAALLRDLDEELAAARAAADDEAMRIRQAAEAEAARVLSAAIGEAEQARLDASDDLHRTERRLAVLRTALADAESRFRRLAATAANEAGTLTALADQDVLPRDEPVSSDVTIDLTDDRLRSEADQGLSAVAEPVAPGPQPPKRDPEAGFYQRRLAGLRDRLEKSGHPPE